MYVVMYLLYRARVLAGRYEKLGTYMYLIHSPLTLPRCPPATESLTPRNPTNR